MKAVVPVLGLVAAIIALATPAAAEPTRSFTMAFARADLNGDGTLDVVIARPAPGNPDKQILTAIVDGQRTVAFIPIDRLFGVQPQRVGDIDGNGRDEIFVTELGANTAWISVWELGQVWHQLRYPDGREMYLHEGGGISSVVGYGCEVVNGQRQLYTVGGTLVDQDNLIYSGGRDNFVVEDGVATRVSYQHISGPRDAFPSNHATCV